MNAARIQFTKKNLANDNTSQTIQVMSTLEGDLIETKNMTCLDQSLKTKNDPYCHFQISKILPGEVDIKVLDLGNHSDMALELNKAITVENPENNESYTLTLLSTRIEEEFTGIEF